MELLATVQLMDQTKTLWKGNWVYASDFNLFAPFFILHKILYHVENVNLGKLLKKYFSHFALNKSLRTCFLLFLLDSLFIRLRSSVLGLS